MEEHGAISEACRDFCSKFCVLVLTGLDFRQDRNFMRETKILGAAHKISDTDFCNYSVKLHVQISINT